MKHTEAFTLCFDILQIKTLFDAKQIAKLTALNASELIHGACVGHYGWVYVTRVTVSVIIFDQKKVC
jgi:hypothetical protein